MHGHFRLKLLVAAVSLGVASTAFAATGVAGGKQMVAVTQATPLTQGARIMGVLPDSHPVHIEVALKMRHQGKLHTFIANAHSPSALIAKRALTPTEFRATYSPTPSQAKKVVAYLHSHGFTNVKISDNRMLVSADGTSADAQAAFSTHLARVQTAKGQVGYMNTSAAQVPAGLEDVVLSVVGLQDVHYAHTYTRMDSNGKVQPQAVTGHNPMDWQHIYGGSNLSTAAGVPVGIITSGALSQTITDLNSFTSSNGLSQVTTQTINVNGTSNDSSGVGEWNLDSQNIVGMAGGKVGKIVFYNIPSLSNANLTADINRIVSDNAVKIINVSLGECETYTQQDGSAAAQDQAFQQAVAQGQTFSISTGDSGADECGDGGTTPSWPAASQYVVAVAGTRVNTSGTNWVSETVWTDTGGSESKFEPQPSWQNGLFNGSRRGVADVAYPGDPSSGALVIVNGGTQQIGGTSLSAPMFAGFWARVLAIKGSGVGFAAPLLYDLPSSDFHDITSGNNHGEQAGPGYDLASGLGSIIMGQAVDDLGGGTNPPGNTPPTASFTDSIDGLSVSFTDTSSDSDGSIASRSWNFGDGSTSTSINPSHTYTRAGTYTVKLTVTDNDGASNSASKQVTVSGGDNGGSDGKFDNATDTPIPDGGSTTSNINVSGEPGAAPSNLKVHVDIVHPYRGDLRITLYAPGGASVVLKQPDYYDYQSNVDQTWTVNASAVSGNGAWKLKVDDVYTGYSGYIDDWSLQF